MTIQQSDLKQRQNFYRCCRCNHEWNSTIFFNRTNLDKKALDHVPYNTPLNYDSCCPKCNSDYFIWLNFKPIK